MSPPNRDTIHVLTGIAVGAGAAGLFPAGEWLAMAFAATLGSVLCFTWLVQDDT